MPTPDASAFTQFKRLSTVQSKAPDTANAIKPLTHLYAPNTRASNLGLDYLPTLPAKPTTARTRTALPWQPVIAKNVTYLQQKYIR